LGRSDYQGGRKETDALGRQMEQELEVRDMPIRRAILWLVVGLVLLVISSRILVCDITAFDVQTEIEPTSVLKFRENVEKTISRKGTRRMGS
jgi:Ca2+/Na+ antiporter